MRDTELNFAIFGYHLQLKLVLSPPVAYFTKMREGTQDKGPEYDVGESQREGTFWI